MAEIAAGTDEAPLKGASLRTVVAASAAGSKLTTTTQPPAGMTTPWGNSNSTA